MATRVREKAAKRAEQRDTRPHATAKYVRISWWARSHGRADMIHKRTSHITVVLDQK